MFLKKSTINDKTEKKYNKYAIMHGLLFMSILSLLLQEGEENLHKVELRACNLPLEFVDDNHIDE